MSIQKFNDSSELQQELVPFTQINTKILQSIKNMEAGFVWTYLLSLPSGWKVIKQQLKKHFGIGDLKIKKIFSYLNKHRLIEYIVVRKDKKIERWDIRVLNGSQFIDLENTTEKDDKKQSVKDKSYTQPTGSKTNPVGFQPGCESRTIKEIQSYKKNKKIKKIDPVFYEKTKTQNHQTKCTVPDFDPPEKIKRSSKETVKSNLKAIGKILGKTYT